MAKREKDDIADALARMAAGEAETPEPEVSPQTGPTVTPAPNVRLAAPMPRPAGAPASASPGGSGSGLRSIPRVNPNPGGPTPGAAKPGGTGSANWATSSGLAATKPITALAAKQATAAMATLNFRQTIIPPLLTLGVLMLLTGAASLVLGEDYVIGTLDMWMKITALLIGLCLLGTAAANILQVRKALSPHQ